MASQLAYVAPHRREPGMFNRCLIRPILVILATLVVAFFPALAQATPSFAQQTGQPCTACHIGAFGPQLTAFGRAFKIGGYTQTGGDATIPVPFSLMLLGSYSNT